jgi:hypothetical protein
MFAKRSLILCGALALAGPAFAADPSAASATTRDARMDAALKDFESGKAPMAVPMPAPPASSHGMKKHPPAK